jgi:hypothetical protein
MRPDGYFHARDDDGTLTISENDPGLGAVRVHYKPVGTFDDDREVEFRMGMGAWTAVVEQWLHDRNQRIAKKEAEAAAAKALSHGQGKKPDLRGDKAGAPQF